MRVLAIALLSTLSICFGSSMLRADENNFCVVYAWGEKKQNWVAFRLDKTDPVAGIFAWQDGRGKHESTLNGAYDKATNNLKIFLANSYGLYDLTKKNDGYEGSFTSKYPQHSRPKLVFKCGQPMPGFKPASLGNAAPKKSTSSATRQPAQKLTFQQCMDRGTKAGWGAAETARYCQAQ